jgi:hypothetical protein
MAEYLSLGPGRYADCHVASRHGLAGQAPDHSPAE